MNNVNLEYVEKAIIYHLMYSLREDSEQIDIYSKAAKEMFDLACRVEDVAVLFPAHRKFAKNKYFHSLYTPRSVFAGDTYND